MRQKTKYTGVYARKHSTRRHLGRQDICYDITYKDSHGKKVWLKAGWVSEGITAQMASAMRAEKMREKVGIEAHQQADTPMTFEEAFKLYADTHLSKVKQPQFAHENFKRIIMLKDIPIDKITSYDIDKLICTMQERGYSNKTIKHAIVFIQSVYNKLIAWGIFDGTPPTKGCTSPRVDNARVRYLTEEEAQRLLNAIKNRSYTWYCISFISLCTGMRLGEILGLQWQDIDFAAKSIYLRDAKAGSRTVIISQDVKDLLLKIKATPSHPQYIFAARGQTTPSKKTSQTFGRCVAALGFNKGITDTRQKVVFHTLRHTFASWLAIKGVPLYVISQLLGHRSLEMTQRYAHLCPDVQRDAVNMLDGLIMIHE